jgi:hypothetical protein
MEINNQIIMKNVFSLDKIEDNNQARISEFCDVSEIDQENGILLRIISWDKKKKHKIFNNFVGRKVKITIEIDD